jgi:hypothetical protein
MDSSFSSQSTDHLRELASILALGFIRMRLRQSRQKTQQNKTENLLDDVAPRAMVRTGEGRTTEKRADQP